MVQFLTDSRDVIEGIVGGALAMYIYMNWSTVKADATAVKTTVAATV